MSLANTEIVEMSTKYKAVDRKLFKAAAGSWASGVAVVTANDGQTLSGCTASAVCSVSLEPPLMLVCLGHQSRTLATITRSRSFAINMLRAGTEDLAVRFASADDAKIAEIDYELSTMGNPLLDDCVTVMECVVQHMYSGGDHTIVVGLAVGASVMADPPLLYHRGKFELTQPIAQAR